MARPACGMSKCFVCDILTPCYAFAGHLICGDCASDGGLLYAELADGAFTFEFTRREIVRPVLSFEADDLPLDVIGPVVRFHKIKLDRELEQITSGTARLVSTDDRRRGSLTMRLLHPLSDEEPLEEAA